MTLSVSIIIPAYNAEKTLLKCLQSVFASISSDDEVIVVNDASNDHTPQIAETFRCNLISITKNNGAAYCRNIGAKKAIKDLILFVDSDVLITKENVDNLKKYFAKQKNVHSVTMNVSLVNLNSGFFSDFKNLYMNFIISESEDSVNYIYGSCCATRKMGFINWPENMRLTEDSLWGYQQRELGLEIHCLKDIQVTHLKKYNFLNLIKNDFLISSFFARSFLEFNRWSTLYTKESFGHTSKTQKLSVVLASIALILMLIAPLVSISFFILWFVLNNRIFRFLNKERGFVFVMKSIVWYYFTNIVYFAGILYGAFFYRSKLTNIVEREAI